MTDETKSTSYPHWLYHPELAPEGKLFPTAADDPEDMTGWVESPADFPSHPIAGSGAHPSHPIAGGGDTPGGPHPSHPIAGGGPDRPTNPIAGGPEPKRRKE